MEIDKVRIRNFKRISSIDIELSDINYIVGGNNSGKSSILQAIHMAVGLGQLAAEYQQQVIAESELRYCPTGDFPSLGNKAPYENRKDGSRGKVWFHGKSDDNEDASYRIEMYKARNFNNVGVDRGGVYQGFGQHIVDTTRLFSVFVPGLAGIPHFEEMQNYAAVFRKAAGGEANLVFRNILRLLEDKKMIDLLEELLKPIVGPVKFRIAFNEKTDLHVQVYISLKSGHHESSYVPVDMAGTGVLQITQIIAYVLLFRPKLLLIDEPDSHLHPSRQSVLSTVFDRISNEFECKIIVSTHSRHLISAAPENASILWIKKGKLQKDADVTLTTMLMDLGALDEIDAAGTDILFCTEDAKKKSLRQALDKIETEKDIKVISYNGVTNASSAEILAEAGALFATSPAVIVHRDRDFLTDEEITRWGEPFENKGIKVFCPNLQDVESYFVTLAHLTDIFGEEKEKEISEELADILKELRPQMRKKFREKRRDAIKRFWAEGGGPAANELWPNDDEIPDGFEFGKMVLPEANKRIREVAGSNHYPTRRAPQSLTDEIKEFLEGQDLLE